VGDERYDDLARMKEAPMTLSSRGHTDRSIYTPRRRGGDYCKSKGYHSSDANRGRLKESLERKFLQEGITKSALRGEKEGGKRAMKGVRGGSRGP